MYIILIYILLALFLIFEQVSEKRYPRLEKIIFFTVLLLFLVRFNLGRDYMGYKPSFDYFLENPHDLLLYARDRNPGFNLLMYGWMRLFPEYRWFMLLINVITMSLCGYTIWNHSKNLLLSLLVFIGSGVLEVYYASGIRQMLSMSVFFFAFYRFIPKKKYLWYELFMLFSLSVHEATLPALFVPLIIQLSERFKKHPVPFFARMIIISGVIAAVLGLSLTWITNHLGDYSWAYENVISYFQKANFSVIGILMELVYGFLMMILYQLQENKEDDFLIQQILVVLFSVFIYLCFSAFSLMSRVSDFLQIILIILFPALIEGIKVKKSKVSMTIVILLLNLFLLVMDLRTNVPAIAENFSKDFTVMDYPYICIFDTQAIAELHGE